MGNQQRFDAAADSLERALELNPDFARPSAILAAVYGYLGQAQAGLDILEPYWGEYWATSIFDSVIQFPYQHKEDRARLEQGLRLTGLPEFYTY